MSIQLMPRKALHGQLESLQGSRKQPEKKGVSSEKELIM
jgi:hypothetical protein